MPDVASLVLSVDSRQATAASAALDSFQRAAGGAANAADKLTASGAGSGKAVQSLANAAAPAVQAMGNMAKGANDNSKAHQGMSVQAQAAFHSIRSLGEAMAAGQPLTQALSQQLNHLSFAASGPGGIVGAFKQAGGALLAMINPTTAIIAALGAVAVGGALVVRSLANTEKQFDDTGHAADLAVGRLHKLASAAAFKGIDTPDFLKAMDKFAGSVYDAKNNMGGLAEVMRANGKSASDFTDYLEKAADLIKNASSDQARLQLLQQMGLPATMQWVRFLSQGADGIKDAVKQAVQWGDTADAKLIDKAREFDERWNTAWRNFADNSKNAAISALSYLDKLNPARLQDIYQDALRKETGNPGVTAAQLNGGNRLTARTDTSDFYNGLGTGAPGNAAKDATKDFAYEQRKIALAQQPLALMGQAQTAKQAAEKQKDDKDDGRRHLRAA